MVHKLAALALLVLLLWLGGCGVERSLIVDAPACQGVRASYATTNGVAFAAVVAEVCRGPDGTTLPEDAARAVLGGSLWRTPGPTIDLLTASLGRSVARPADEPRRMLTLLREQATERWGPRPIAPGADDAAQWARLGDAVVWLLCCGAAAVIGVLVLVAVVSGLRRGWLVLVAWPR